jgi:hypothetical protein
MDEILDAIEPKKRKRRSFSLIAICILSGLMSFGIISTFLKGAGIMVGMVAGSLLIAHLLIRSITRKPKIRILIFSYLSAGAILAGIIFLTIFFNLMRERVLGICSISFSVWFIIELSLWFRWRKKSKNISTK